MNKQERKEYQREYRRRRREEMGTEAYNKMMREYQSRVSSKYDIETVRKLRREYYKNYMEHLLALPREEKIKWVEERLVRERKKLYRKIGLE